MAVKANTGRKRVPAQGLISVTAWKQQATDLLLENETICKLLYYPTEDWSNKPNLTDEQKGSLVGNNIKQYKFIDGIATTQQSYISLGISQFSTLEEFRVFSNDFMQGFIYFYILCDMSILKTTTGIRSDLIMQEVYKTFHRARGFGAGELILKEAPELWVDSNKAGGYVLGFKVVDIG